MINSKIEDLRNNLAIFRKRTEHYAYNSFLALERIKNRNINH